MKLNIKEIQWINLFERVTRIKSSACFDYAGNLVFLVKPALVSRAVGRDGMNVKRLSGIVHKRIKIIAIPSQNAGSLERFTLSIIYPNKIKQIQITDNEVLIRAGKSKASLIGRDRARELELQGVLENLFKIQKLRII